MAWREMLRSWLREPLVHFLLAGLAVFLFFNWRGDPVDPASRTITITAGQVQSLTDRWVQTWQRSPTQGEIDGLIRDYIKEEVYNREARRMGLDEDDFVVRRRLRSKMEELARAEVENITPDDATLQTWLDKHVAKYASDPSYSFDQIYLGTGDVQSVTASTLAGLKEGKDWRDLGKKISLPATLENASKTEIARDFGDSFAADLRSQKQGSWSGPVTSGFGKHLVRIRHVTMSAKPKLADVRQAVFNDWREATINGREDRAYQALLDGYTIKIKRP